MKLKRRPWLLLLSLIVILWLGLLIGSPVASLSTQQKALHLLNRLSFGPRPGDLEMVKSTGIKTYIQSQLDPESIPEPAELTAKLADLTTLQMTPTALWQEYRVPQKTKGGQPTSPEERRMGRQKMRRVSQEAINGKLLRAIASPRQLEEVMVDFWYNHFNVFVNKGQPTRIWVGSYEETAIRPYVLGRFRDLLGATARHPAMLFYLDNWQNTDPKSKGARGRFKGLNENYARELMELHTLGVDGGYTQEDVVALARILTGWGIVRRPRGQDESGFIFQGDRHDYGDKAFLGTTIKGTGMDEVEQALDILARHPSTARYISFKLAQYFVADEPPSSLVETLTQRFQNTDGDIRAVLETLFTSKEFWDTKYYRNKFKTPYQYIISAARATGVNPEPMVSPLGSGNMMGPERKTDNSNLKAILGMVRQLNMQPYGCPTPDGYENTQDAWLNPDAMLRRISFGTAIAHGRLNKRQPVDAAKLAKTLGNDFSAHTRKVVEESPKNLKAALILGSPETMYR